MSERLCPRHGAGRPCTCAMGNLYRFVEPVLLFLLRKKGHSYGYQLASELNDHALTDAEVEIAALYRTLRQLEANGCVTSSWDVSGSGPARRVYALTAHGEEHLAEWIVVLEHMTKSMARLTSAARTVLKKRKAAVPKTPRATGARPRKRGPRAAARSIK